MMECGLVFCFEQKPAYEMRISDWISDVCSSDLPCRRHHDAHDSAWPGLRIHAGRSEIAGERSSGRRPCRGQSGVGPTLGPAEDVRRSETRTGNAVMSTTTRARPAALNVTPNATERIREQIGRASCRERGCQSV